MLLLRTWTHCVGARTSIRPVAPADGVAGRCRHAAATRLTSKGTLACGQLHVAAGGWCRPEAQCPPVDSSDGRKGGRPAADLPRGTCARAFRSLPVSDVVVPGGRRRAGPGYRCDLRPDTAPFTSIPLHPAQPSPASRLQGSSPNPFPICRQKASNDADRGARARRTWPGGAPQPLKPEPQAARRMQPARLILPLAATRHTHGESLLAPPPHLLRHRHRPGVILSDRASSKHPPRRPQPPRT